jgi:hypothetical protein
MPPPVAPRRRKRVLPSVPDGLPRWLPDGIWGSAGLVWNPEIAWRPVCASVTPEGTIVVTDRAGLSLFFSDAKAARALRPQVAQTELLGRLLHCPYIWGERQSVFLELFRHMGRGISSDLGAAKAMQDLIATRSARVKPTPTGFALKDCFLQPVLPRF